MDRRPRWRLISHFLLRRAGFPFHLIEQLACPGACMAARELARREEAAEALRQVLLRELFSAEVKRLAGAGERQALKALSGWRRAVGQRQPREPPEGPWAEALRAPYLRWSEQERACAQARQIFTQTFEAEQRSARETLWRLAATPRVREALFLLVPAVAELVTEPRLGDRALERRLYAFVQRLASKNETTSFFGPLTHARVDPTVETPTFGPEALSGVTRQEIFPSFWAVAALAAACAQDPEVRRDLPVRRVSASRVEGERAFGPTGAEVALPAPARVLFAHVNDHRTLAELSARAGMSLSEAEGGLRMLEKAGFVRRDLEPLSTTHYPLADVQRRLPSTPAGDRWRERLSRFEGLLGQFERSPFEARQRLLPQLEACFEEVSGKSAHRGAGQMYADRSVFYEECAGDGQPMRLPLQDAQRLEAELTPVLQMGASYGRVRHRALRRLATDTLAELGGGPIPFLAFATALDERIVAGRLEPLDAGAGAFLSQLNALVAAHSDGRVARLPVEALFELLGSDDGWRDDGWRFASPDVMIERTQEDGFRPVIGEVHPYVFAWGSQGHFAPDAEALQAAFAADLRPWGGREQLAVVLRRRRHKGLVSEAFPGRFIEVTGRGSDDPERRIAIADLRVAAGEQGPVLHGPHGPLTLYVGEEDHPHLRAFAPPLVEMPKVRLGDHTPRVEIGAVVFQRERWRFTPEELAEVVSADGDAALALAVARVQERHGLPQHLFLTAASEPKPICLDLAVPLAHAHLQRLAAREDVILVEMVPAPDALWLKRSAGGHTSELRIGMVREP